jgi:hypothetical protein
MRNIYWAFCTVGVIALASVVAQARPAAEGKNSLVVTFKDGHQERFDRASISRIDLDSPAKIVFKDGHQQKINADDVAQIEFENSGQSATTPGRAHFIGKWKVGQGNGNDFFITLEGDGEARKSIGASHGTWVFVDGEARVSWDDGWHDAIRKVGTKHEKFAYEPGRTFSDKPANVTEAVNTEPRPI